MELTQHFVGHCIAIFLLSILNTLWLHFTNDWTYFLALIPSFVISCDLDKIFKKWGWHRHFYFHSALLPLTIYFALRKYLLFLPNQQLWGELSLWFFFPVIVHLGLDYKPFDVADAILGDTKEYIKKAVEQQKKIKESEKKGRKVRKSKINISEGDQEVGGMWQITFKPFTHKTLGFYGSVIWFIGNIVFMIIFSVLQFY